MTRKRPRRKPPAQQIRHDTDPFWKSWRHIAAYIYLTICVFDFVGMPVFYEIINPRKSDSELIGLVQKLDPAGQVSALQILHKERSWEPLTLAENGLFHMAFGAILGVAAWTRGREKASSGFDIYYDNDGFEEDYYSPPRRSRRHQNNDDYDPLPPMRKSKSDGESPDEFIPEPEPEL